MDLAPSSVSRAISSLETSLKSHLFQRTTRTVTPTQSGDLFYGRVAPLLDELWAATREIRGKAKGPSGHLKVCVPVAFGHMVIVPRLKEFHDSYPQIQLELALSDERVDLQGDHYDIAISMELIKESRVQEEGLITRKLGDVNYKLVASPAYIQSSITIQKPDDVIYHNLAALPSDQFSKNWAFKQELDSEDIFIRPQMVLSNAAAVCEVLRSGYGLGLLLDWAVKADLESGALEPVLEEWDVHAPGEQSAIWMVYPARSFMPAKVHAFDDFFAY